MVQERTLPRWYWIAAIAALLFEAIGCTMYLLDMTRDPASLPLDQRAMWEAAPMWMRAAYGTATWVGLAGAIGLLLRRRWAEPLLLASLVAVIVQFSGLLLVPALRDVTPSDALLVPIVIILLCGAVYRFAHWARRRGILR